eukprot:CAMPEP_0203768464 /NCGR_PEP_ID=MMETSP0099_2-20121227/1602_1 /ASSEMBLY_ACC=CAM_ASM_000209 /TAXON_ID=96639 /ORGANISM=" , Strain NY0313808BC1" /LENGTH=196 /DNA_ID=CAMNT_0050665157 /DNA_START=227 /DNA_END=817 /DNA_ORIENTATION=-
MLKHMFPALETKAKLYLPSNKIGTRINTKTLDAFEQRVVEICTQEKGNKVFLVSQSFGARISAHYLSQTVPDNTKGEWTRKHDIPKNLLGSIYLGYPFFKQGQDRSIPLKKLPSNIQSLFISGSSDPFAKGLVTQLEHMDAQINIVEKGKHNVFDPPTNEESRKQILEQIQAFVSNQASNKRPKTVSSANACQHIH